MKMKSRFQNREDAKENLEYVKRWLNRYIGDLLIYSTLIMSI